MKSILFILSSVLFLFQCSTVPVTGRRQLDLVPQSQLLALSFEQYNQFLSQHKVISGTTESALVKKVGYAIQRAVVQYFNTIKKPEILKGYKWEFNLVLDSSVNAFAMPGGKVAVFTGILPVTENEQGLAVVLGHEIAHAVANHGNERMSQLLLVQLGGMALSEALSEKPELTQQLALIAFGVGTQVGVLLPYSRIQESEADRLGLIFMAMAGYDPRTAIGFWQRMEQQNDPTVPEFLSTHPATSTRISDIESQIPEAMKYYHPKVD
ncbi:MAG: M48 family metallopeptidase [Fibrobacter sp.]|nr:M48 family metallopeptidase [Fibrobacter sp.]